MRTIINKKILLLSLPIGILLSYISTLSSEVVERVFSEKIFKTLGQVLSSISGILPFSAAEVIVVILVVISIWYIISTIRKLITSHSERLSVLKNFILNVLMWGGTIYLLFLIVWGINYHRQPFSRIANLEIRPSTISELKGVCEDIIIRTNKLRQKVKEDGRGVMSIDGGFRDVFKRSSLGYRKAASIYPELGGSFGSPKGVMLSEAMSYAGISGVYFPFTAEANVNISQPDSMLPNTACHEMAHQRGFAREDEANYIAYLACIMHPDVDFQYSGTMLALTNCMNALYRHDKNLYKELVKKYGEGVKRDLIDLNDYWSAYEGPVEEISDRINDTYLKANNQKDGVHSYGRMVDLILAEYRKQK